jgi:alkanesulfonate monooxygenase SsuD/methylene tetrahydromethanopterin reductase-like flavin-dependent oxidoreductase (luciferase family)
MRALWGNGNDYHGEFVNFDGALSFPKPASGSGLPILVGGQTEAALKRAAAYGNGWCGFNLTPDETAEMVGKLRQMLKTNGRAAEQFEFSLSPVATASPADMKDYRKAGIDELYLTPVFQRSLATQAEVTALLEELANAWVVPAAKL